jgi:hypothetical protein
VKFDKGYFNESGFKLKDNDFQMTLNHNIDKNINEMIKEIVEKDIKSQISEKGSRKYQNYRPLN